MVVIRLIFAFFHEVRIAISVTERRLKIIAEEYVDRLWGCEGRPLT